MSTHRFHGRSTADEVLAGRDLRGRTILVTGASAGIGLETARALAAVGARVLLACRTAEGADATVRSIRARHPDADLVPVLLDLASLDGVRRAASDLPVSKLDVVICNAGLFTPRYEETADGIEKTVGVCHFGHFLLVTSLVDRLRAAGKSRVVMVSSESHRFPSTLRFDRFPLDRARYQGLVAYGQAKLCNVLFANELGRRHASDGIVASSLHPGSLIGTSIFRDSIAAKALALAARPFTKTLEQGAATTVYCAVDPSLEGVTGRYYSDCAEKPASAFAGDAGAARELWERSVARVAS